MFEGISLAFGKFFVVGINLVLHPAQIFNRFTLARIKLLIAASRCWSRSFRAAASRGGRQGGDKMSWLAR